MVITSRQLTMLKESEDAARLLLLGQECTKLSVISSSTPDTLFMLLVLTNDHESVHTFTA